MYHDKRASLLPREINQQTLKKLYNWFCKKKKFEQL